MLDLTINLFVSLCVLVCSIIFHRKHYCGRYGVNLIKHSFYFIYIEWKIRKIKFPFLHSCIVFAHTYLWLMIRLQLRFICLKYRNYKNFPFSDSCQFILATHAHHLANVRYINCVSDKEILKEKKEKKKTGSFIFLTQIQLLV